MVRSVLAITCVVAVSDSGRIELVVYVVGAEQQLITIQLARPVKDRLPCHKHIHKIHIGKD